MYIEIPRTLEEQIRDLYFDKIMEIVLGSPYKGELAIYEERDISGKIWESLDSHKAILHLSKPRPETLWTVLRELPPDLAIWIYI